MKTWIALLRGINVGGNNKLPMASLVAEMEKLGLQRVQSYIQSGNVIFQSSGGTAASLALSIGEAIRANFGFKPQVIVISKQQLNKAIKDNPIMVNNDCDGNLLHLFFLDHQPVNVALVKPKLDAVKLSGEVWHVHGEVFYLHTPGGFAHSKLAVKAEKILAVAATARNWRTVTKLVELAAEYD